jgi:hypothetical protein
MLIQFRISDGLIHTAASENVRENETGLRGVSNAGIGKGH